MASLAFWSCARLSEVITSRANPEKHLLLRHINKHYHNNKLLAHAFTLPEPKTNTNHKQHLFLPVRQDSLDATDAIEVLVHSATRRTPPFQSSKDQLLWHLSSGMPATTSWFKNQLWDRIQFKAGESSFRSGGTTHYLHSGWTDDELQRWGRWTSEAFYGYLRTNPDFVLSIYFRHLSETDYANPVHHPHCQ
ncbi:hypothetical protein BC829DRAFT_253745 [Chytridium lagenaria]|nr:hypothetical protein BC829DRAFT_253745 [Chytridium lagenaria]